MKSLLLAADVSPILYISFAPVFKIRAQRAKTFLSACFNRRFRLIHNLYQTKYILLYVPFLPQYGFLCANNDCNSLERLLTLLTICI